MSFVQYIFSPKRKQEEIFLKNEYHTILGARRKVLVLLSAVLFVVFASIIFAQASLLSLKEKMNSPFTSWINIPVSNSAHLGHYKEIKSFIDTCEERGQYSIVETSGAYTDNWDFYVNNFQGRRSKMVISFSLFNDSALLKGVLADENLIFKCGEVEFFNPQSWKNGIIISEGLLNEIGANEEQLCFERQEAMIFDGYNLRLRILAVVKVLPYKTDVFCENTLANTLQNGEIVPNINTNQVKIAVKTDAEEQTGLTSKIEEQIDRLLVGATFENSAPNSEMIAQNNVLHFQTDAPIDFHRYRKIYDVVSEDFYSNNAAVLFDHNLILPTQLNDYGQTEQDKFDILSVRFSDYQEVQGFEDEVSTLFKMKLDMDEVESKKNFTLVTFLTIGLILGVVFFALFTIIIFLSSTMRNHLEKIKMNLGTFMAFGLSKRFLMNGYSQILLKLIGISLLISAAAIYLIYLVVILPLQATTDLPEIFDHIKIATNPWLWLMILIIVSLTTYIFRLQLSRFLRNTPGDLIYGRS